MFIPHRRALIALLLVLAFFVWLPTAALHSAETADPAPESSETRPNAGESSGLDEYGEMADEWQETLAETLSDSADWLDSFFRDERMEIEENKSSLRVKLSSWIEDGEGVDFRVRARLKLVLPHFEDKLHIVFTGERDEDRDGKGDAFDDLLRDETTDNNFNLGLRYFFRMAHENNISFRVGMRVNEFPPVVYGGPRFSFSKPFDPWLIRFTQNIRYYSDSLWQARSILDFERPLWERFFLRTTAEGAWYEEEDGYFYELKCRLFHALDENRAFEYQWLNYFETRPDHRFEESVVAVKYRQRIWRQWLFFEITPQVSFREDDDYRPTAGITFAMEGIIGKDIR